jgi:hypothetical protein
MHPHPAHVSRLPEDRFKIIERIAASQNRTPDTARNSLARLPAMPVWGLNEKAPATAGAARLFR